MRYCLIVDSEATPGQDDALEAWIDQQHIPDILRTKAFKSAQRLRVRSTDGSPMRHLLLYEVETDDLPSVFEENSRRRANGDLPRGEAQNPMSIRVTVCEVAAPKVFAVGEP